MSKLIILVISLISFSSCYDTPGPNYFDKICKENSTFRIDSSIQTSVAEGHNFYLSMKSIAVPSDTFFFRIQYWTDTTMKLFEYSFYKLKTSYKAYTFPLDKYSQRILFDKTKDKLNDFLKTYGSKTIDNAFIRELEKNNIFELPSSDKISNYPVDFDRSYVIEYSNKCKYNAVLFTDPYQNSKKFKEAKYLADFLDYLKREFDF